MHLIIPLTFGVRSSTETRRGVGSGGTKEDRTSVGLVRILRVTIETRFERKTGFTGHLEVDL